MSSGDTHLAFTSDLLDHVSYNPAHDYLLFVGDLLAKSSHATSLDVLDFLTRNHNITGTERIFPVRGNHDQFIIQWRGWREWFEGLAAPVPAVQSHAPFFFRTPSDAVTRLTSAFYSVLGADVVDDAAVSTLKKGSRASPVSTGREFLQLIEAEWALEKVANEPDPE